MLTARYHGDRLTAIASEREEKGVELLVVGRNVGYDILLTNLCIEYLSKWNGELPDVVTGDSASIMIPVNPTA